MITLLQRLLDGALADQGDARRRLERHAGRRVQVEVLGGAATLAIEAGGRVRIVGIHGDPNADLRVRISSESFAALATGDPLRGASLEGAADLADDFSAAARLLRFDPAEWLAPFAGDIVAHRIGNGLKALGAAGIDAIARSEALLRDGMSAGSLPMLSRPAAKALDADIRQLFDAVEALGRRVDRLTRVDPR